jgi:hypothetical protein
MFNVRLNRLKTGSEGHDEYTLLLVQLTKTWLLTRRRS